MKNDYSVGIVVYHKFKEGKRFLIIQHEEGHWGFPKGHPERGESKHTTAARELLEETNIEKIRLIDGENLLTEEYNFVDNKGVNILKKVDYFIAESLDNNVKIDGKEIIDFKWCTQEEASRIITFKESRKVFEKANEFIKKMIKTKE